MLLVELPGKTGSLNREPRSRCGQLVPRSEWLLLSLVFGISGANASLLKWGCNLSAAIFGHPMIDLQNGPSKPTASGIPMVFHWKRGNVRNKLTVCCILIVQLFFNLGMPLFQENLAW